MADVVSAPSWRPPWTVIAFTGCELAFVVNAVAMGETFHPLRWASSLLIAGLVNLGLWKGLRVVWWIAIAAQVWQATFGLAYLSTSFEKVRYALIVAQLILLVLPPTRRWIFLGPAGA